MIPRIFIGVPPVKLWFTLVVTVTTWPGTSPLPDSILDIFNGSVANAPTISNSGLWGANPFGATGYFWVIALLAAASLYALDNLL